MQDRRANERIYSSIVAQANLGGSVSNERRLINPPPIRPGHYDPYPSATISCAIRSSRCSLDHQIKH